MKEAENRGGYLLYLHVIFCKWPGLSQKSWKTSCVATDLASVFAHVYDLLRSKLKPRQLFDRFHDQLEETVNKFAF